MTSSRVLILLSLLTTALWGCDDPESSQSCVPNTTQACLCPGASDGVQTCRDDGSGYEDCICGGDSDVVSDTGTDTGGSDTAQSDTAQPDTSQGDTNTCSGTLCGTDCVDTGTDTSHCGSCDNVCGSGPNGTAVCTSGTCGLNCAAGFFDCDSDASNGCETDFSCDTLVSVGSGNGAATSVWLSGDGRYMVFASEASDLVANDSNGVADIFLLDRVDGSVQRISVSPTGAEADRASYEPVISEDGKFVAFTSDATNLVAFDQNGKRDLLLYDVEGGTATRVSMGHDGSEGDDDTSGRPAISGDGRYVAFASVATNIVSDDTNGVSDVFVHDKEAGTTERVSVATSGAEGDGPSVQPSISADGRFVAFASNAPSFLYDDNLRVSEDTNGLEDVYLHDRQTQSTDRVSVDSGRVEVSGRSHSPSISADGQFVAFISNAAFGNGPVPTTDEVFLSNVQSGVIERISAGGNNTAANGASRSVSISRDGRFIAFASTANNLAAFDTNGHADIFLFDRQGGMTRVNVNDSGDEANDDSDGPVISTDARFISFVSSASNLIDADSNGVDDLFVVATRVEASTGSVLASCQVGDAWCVGLGCVASLSNFDSCGVCQRTCFDVQTCDNGSCTCPGAKALCGGVCTQGTSCGIFTDSGQRLSDARDVSLGDVDGDGDLDAFLAVRGGVNPSNRVLLNDGDGVFTDSGQTLGDYDSMEVRLGDIDGDGDLDAVVANDRFLGVCWLNDGTGAFSTRINFGSASWRPVDMELGDVDDDGDLDVIVSLGDVAAFVVSFNDGTGNMAGDQYFGVFTKGMSLGDVDDDGDLDVFSARPRTDQSVWLNDGTGAFSDNGQTLAGEYGREDVELGDVDGDGDLDAFVIHSLSEANRVWLNNGTATFTNSGQALGNSNTTDAELGDLDGDGDLDAFVINGNGSYVRVWWNDGGVFTDSGQNPASINGGFAVSLGDLDGDGDLDAFVAAPGNGSRVYLNE